MNTSVRRALEIGAACTALGLLTAGIDGTQALLRQEPVAWGAVLGPELLFWYAWGGSALGIFWLARRWALGTPGQGAALVVHAVASAVVPMLAFGLYLLAYAGLRQAGGWWGPALAGPALLADLRGQLTGYYLRGPGVLLGVVTYWGLVAVASARSYYGRLQAVELGRSRLETQLAQAQLQTLQAQLHPHFLFNTFNSISALLQTDPAAADHMLARLGDFLRLTLANSQVEFVPLAEELAFTQRYLAIEAIRFADRLRVEVEVEPAARDARVPALLLQPLVENAVKHGIARRIEPGCIALRAALRDGQLCLQLSNDTGPDAGPGPLGQGLGATRARLQQLYGTGQVLRAERLPGRQFVVAIRLPYQAFSGPTDAAA